MATPTYKDAGVDLDLYDQAMRRLPGLVGRTTVGNSRVLELSGGFAGLFRVNRSDPPAQDYVDPVLVSGTDGVGTKLKIAGLTGTFNTVGIDLVAMSVNDCLCLGAEPLFFLDYIALGKDNPDLIADLVEGVSEGCVQAGAALLGGETAIMPDIYPDGEFDMAGFCVGIAERADLIQGDRIAPGDVVIGLASSGLHSNGYSLVRHVVFKIAELSINSKVPELGETVGDALLTPTRIYARPLQAVLNRLRGTTAVHGLAHITGGGLAENIARIVPEGCRVVIERGTWEQPPVFNWLQSIGGVEDAEMERVFNLGIGFVIVVAESHADAVMDVLRGNDGVAAWRIGQVLSGDGPRAELVGS